MKSKNTSVSSDEVNHPPALQETEQYQESNTTAALERLPPRSISSYKWVSQFNLHDNLDSQIELHEMSRHRMSDHSAENETPTRSASASMRRLSQSIRVVGKLEESKPSSMPKVNYHKFANVFAKPLTDVEDFVAPSFPKTDRGTKFLKDALSEKFIFSGLTDEELMLLINAMHRYKFHANEAIIEQGDTGDYFYVLRKGQVRFLVDGTNVGEASNGVSFGELALLYDSPRAATVLAVSECLTYRVDQHTFRTLLASNKNQEEKKRVELLRRVEIFNGIGSKELTKIAEAMTQIHLKDGKLIIRKGDVGSVFYIIQNGEVKISEIGLGDDQCGDRILKPGQYFGERALVTGEKRSANATAIGSCTLLWISKESFETIIGSLENIINQTNKKRMLMKVPSLSRINLQHHELNRLLKMIVPLTFRKDKTLLEEGKPVINIRRGLYLIVDGEIIVSSSKEKVQSLKMGDFFGEDMLNDDSEFTSPHTITVSANVIFDVLTLDAICSALGGLNRLRGVSARISNNLDKSITSTTFNKVTILGAGTFGQVWLVTDKKKHTPYALKIQNKHELLESEQYHGALREKSLMSSLNHPFIVQLVNSFQDENNLFMVMTFVQGGELFNVIHTDKTDGIPEVSARFYSANIYDALMYLHERQILYRDLKPENVLINEEDGYCVLIDLGFAKEVADKTYTLCGTPLYLAPEVILSRGYDKSVDNWSFGAVIFEMVAGYSPFYSPDIDQMTLFKRIAPWQAVIMIFEIIRG